MRKIFCDICEREIGKANQYYLPKRCIKNAYDAHGAIVFKTDLITDDNCDVCDDCRKKIPTLLELIPALNDGYDIYLKRE